MNERDRQAIVGGTDRPSGERDLARVGVVDARKDLDQGRLAGAVLPEQRMNFAAADVEVDAIERDRRGETLDEPGHDEERPAVRRGFFVPVHRFSAVRQSSGPADRASRAA